MDDKSDSASTPFAAFVSEDGGVAVVTVSGEVDIATESRLRAALAEAVTRASSPPRVVVDLHQVTFMDSSGLGVLIEKREEMHELVGELWLVNGHGMPERLLRVAGLEETFRTAASLESALRKIAEEE